MIFYDQVQSRCIFHIFSRPPNAVQLGVIFLFVSASLRLVVGANLARHFADHSCQAEQEHELRPSIANFAMRVKKSVAVGSLKRDKSQQSIESAVHTAPDQLPVDCAYSCCFSTSSSEKLPTFWLGGNS
jgi:hypothetical protein